MLTRNIAKTSWCRIRARYFHKDNTARKLDTEKCDTSKIRNIGIMAHIDAGK